MNMMSVSDVFTRSVFIAVIYISGMPLTAAQQPTHRQQFTFSWQFSADASLTPRGGSSRGAAVSLAQGPSPQWQHLRAAGISKFERDRRAILAMAGDYRTSFDFIETVGFSAGFEPARPYQSWGTERIYVVEDSARRIVLQHIMAMFIRGEDDQILGPFVQKHWRQEWVYEPEVLHVYAGGDKWQRVAVQSEEGRWAQSVFQVDDSPRYAAVGQWQHNASFSAWHSDDTWRPLPRRETSVRDDYSVLTGTNRHTILPGGWVQEEENLKTVLETNGMVSTQSPYLVRELGVNRYELINDFDFSAADDYWDSTKLFWADVRAAWHEIFAERTQFQFHEVVDGDALWQAMFEYAAELENGAEYAPRAARRFVQETLARHLE